MKKNKYTGLRALFLDEFYLKIGVLEKKVKTTIRKKLGNFPEAVDIDNIFRNCIDDIERILKAQFDASTKEHFNHKEKKRKLALFKKDKSYVQKYILEATKSFCRKKQTYWTHGRTKGDANKGETHKAKKVGMAARVHFSGNNPEIETWIDSIASSSFATDRHQPEFVMDVNVIFKKIGLNNKKIKCFWDRFAGITFVEMARQDLDPSATPDKYRKRLNRLILQLAPHLEELEVIFSGQYG